MHRRNVTRSTAIGKVKGRKWNSCLVRNTAWRVIGRHPVNGTYNNCIYFNIYLHDASRFQSSAFSRKPSLKISQTFPPDLGMQMYAVYFSYLFLSFLMLYCCPLRQNERTAHELNIMVQQSQEKVMEEAEFPMPHMIIIQCCVTIIIQLETPKYRITIYIDRPPV